MFPLHQRIYNWPPNVFEGVRTSFSLPLVAVLIATQMLPLHLSTLCHHFTDIFLRLKKPQHLLNCPFNILLYLMYYPGEAALQLAQGQTRTPLVSGPWLMYTGKVQLVPKELHQLTEGIGTDNSTLVPVALTGHPNYLLKVHFIFLLLSKAKFL